MPLTTGANGVAGWPNCLKLKSIIAERSHPLNSQTAISRHGTFTSLNATRNRLLRKWEAAREMFSKSLSWVTTEQKVWKYLWFHLFGCFWSVFVCLVWLMCFPFLVSLLSPYDPSSFSPIIELGMLAKALLSYCSPSALRTDHLCLNLNTVSYPLSVSLIAANYPQQNDKTTITIFHHRNIICLRALKNLFSPFFL